MVRFQFIIEIGILSAPGAFPLFKRFVIVLRASGATEIKLVNDS